MALARWEIEQRRMGNVSGADMAKLLREKYGDIPLPSKGLSAKDKVSPELLHELEKEGFTSIYMLTGKTIQELKEDGQPFWSTWHTEYPSIETIKSRIALIAVNPNELFIPGTESKSLDEQMRLLDNYTSNLQLRIGNADIYTTIGNAADYAELSYTHLDQTGGLLFGADYGNKYTRTSSYFNQEVIVVGNFGLDGRITIDSSKPELKDDSIALAPLVILPLKP